MRVRIYIEYNIVHCVLTSQTPNEVFHPISMPNNNYIINGL